MPNRSIVDYLATNGPSLSSKIIGYLSSPGGTSKANARKLIERSRDPILRFTAIRFAHNQQFLFLRSQYKTPLFWRSLIQAFHATRSVYGHMVNSLLARDGIWPVPYLGIISGSPERLSKHISSSTVLQRLVKIGLIEIISTSDFGPCAGVVDAAMPTPAGDRLIGFRSRLIAEDILIGGLAEWIRNTGLGSWNKVEARNLRRATQPAFGQFNWDFSAPTFVHPLRSPDKTSKGGPINGFVVGDVLLGRDVETQDLEYFLVKTEMMRQQPNTRPFLAIFVSERFTNAALKQGRDKGLLLVTVETLFGREVAAGLTQLIQVLENAAAAIGSDPTVVPTLFKKLDSLKGASLNLRGWLFELLAAHMLKTDGWSIISVGELRRDPDSGELAEVDVLASKGRNIIALECKGYVTNNVDKEDVEKWLTKSVPRIRGSLLSEKFFQKREITYEFWTTSKFNADALVYLQKKEKEIKKFTIDWFDGPDLMRFASGLTSDYASRLLREQYQLS